MLDIKRIREDPDPFRAALARRNLGDAVDRLLEADERRRSLTSRVEELRAAQNRASKAIGAAQGEEKQQLIDEVAKVSAELKEREPELAAAEEDAPIPAGGDPNVPHESAPDGFTDEDAVEVRRNHEEPPVLDFEPRDHAELGAMLGVLDTERGARTSGSRFVYLMGDLVFVQFALMRHAMDVVVEKGFSPMIPPVLVREEAMYGTGFLPTDAVNIYVTREDELYLVGHLRGAAGGVPPRRDPRRGRPPDPLRGLLDAASGARRVRTARTSAACSACISSTRWRCSRSARRRRRGTSTSGSSRSRRRSSGTSRSPIGW